MNSIKNRTYQYVQRFEMINSSFNDLSNMLLISQITSDAQRLQMNNGKIVISYNEHCSQKLRGQKHKKNKDILLRKKVTSIMVALSTWSFWNI